MIAAALPFACGLLLIGGCDDAGVPPDASGDVPDGVACADLEAREVCAMGMCSREPCRTDEVCEAAACIPWEEMSLFADFTLTVTDPARRRVAVEVLGGGFPRRRVEALRFDFGDGSAGWGEALRHDYAAPGVYPVDLEVRLEGHRVLRASKLAVVGEAGAPVLFTIDEIPRYLNGQLPFARDAGTPDDPSDDVQETLTLQVPTHGFSIDVTLLDPALDRDGLSLRADVPMGGRPADAELVDRLVFEDGPTLGVARAHWIPGPSDAVPEGSVTLRFGWRAADGTSSEEVLRLDAIALTPDRDPFDRPMVWLFRTDSDFFTTRLEPGGGSALVSEEIPNGTPDLVEELRLLGAQGPDPISDARYLAWISEAIRSETYRFYGIGPDGIPHDGIAFTIAWQGEPGAPEATSFAVDGDVSMMRFGGTFDGFLGFSGFSVHNEVRVDDSTVERGVATAGLLGALAGTPVVSDALDAIEPGVGAPVGTHPADAIVLDEGFDPDALDVDPELLARYSDLRRIARQIALAIASVTAHEMGHAMGLMPDGPPPEGFFGGDADVTFMGALRTDSHHADFPGLNLMQAGGDLLGLVDESLPSLELPRGVDLLTIAEILALENRLSPYSRAYLQRRLTYASFGRGGGPGARPNADVVGCR